MTIAVNVSRQWTPELSPAKEDAVIGGDWPLRSGVTRSDIEAAADFLVAVKRSRVVAVRNILAVHSATDDGYRVCFDLAVADKRWQLLLNEPAPDTIRWRRGEAWPIKIVGTAELLAGIDTETSRAVANAEDALTLGGFTVRLTSRSRLVVMAPRNASVVVFTK